MGGLVPVVLLALIVLACIMVFGAEMVITVIAYAAAAALAYYLFSHLIFYLRGDKNGALPSAGLPL